MVPAKGQIAQSASTQALKGRQGARPRVLFMNLGVRCINQLVLRLEHILGSRGDHYMNVV